VPAVTGGQAFSLVSSDFRQFDEVREWPPANYDI